MSNPTVVSRDTVKIGKTLVANELHITGGLRAQEQEPRRWSLGPLLSSESKPSWLRPFPIQQIDRIASDIGETLFGGDEISGIGTPLVSRAWTPLNGPHKGMPIDVQWGAIAFNAHENGDEPYSRFARNIAHSIRAAGIRLRDASDGFHKQLVAALADNAETGSRFTNTAAMDIHLAFHSVLSELASARDYLAAALGHEIGAPPNQDAMSRLAGWLAKAANVDKPRGTVLNQMLVAYDSGSADPWLYELSEYRNEFLHRTPFGTARNHHLLQLTIKEVGELHCPLLHMPLSAEDRWAPGEDALKRFVTLYRRMIVLLTVAAEAAPYESTPPHFVVGDG
jgi:hypothetical protein